MITDSNKFIISGGDGGDTCHRMYTTHIRLYLLRYLKVFHDKFLAKAVTEQIANIIVTQTLLEDKPGIYIRHPDLSKWYSDPRNVSRDQLVPVICWHALSYKIGGIGISSWARENQAELLKACIKRYMFAQNIYPNWVDPRTTEVKKKTPDFINFDLWGIFARTWIKSIYFPIALPFVLFGDFFLILTVLVKLFAPTTKDSNNGKLEFRWPGPDDVDDDNLHNMLMTTQHLFPTPLSWLARKLFKKFRKSNFGNTELKEESPIMGALAWYHRNDNPELAELARPLVKLY